MSKTTMSKNEIEQKIRDLKTKLSCQESDIGDWKIAKCIEYSTLGMESPYDLQELHKQRQVIRDEIGALEEELAKCISIHAPTRGATSYASRSLWECAFQKKRRVFPSVSCL